MQPGVSSHVDGQAVQAAQAVDMAGPSTGGTPGPAAGMAPTSIIRHTDLDDLQLLTRAAVGLLTEGVGYFLANMREAQAAIDADPQLLLPAIKRGQETQTELLRYLVIGAVLAGERQATQALENGLRTTVQTTNFVAGIFDRFTDNPLLRPARRPFESVVQNVAATMDAWVKQGRIEEQNGRIVFGRTVTETIDDIISYISDAEELANLVADQINQQGSSVAGMALDTGRTATLVADTVFERFVRRMLRRPPRDELPTSPMAGVEQDMYTPEKRVHTEKLAP